MTSAGAARQRLLVERKKNGLCCRRVVVHEVLTNAVLCALGYLPSDDPTPEAADKALSKWTHALLTRQHKKLWPEL